LIIFLLGKLVSALEISNIKIDIKKLKIKSNLKLLLNETNPKNFSGIFF